MILSDCHKQVITRFKSIFMVLPVSKGDIYKTENVCSLLTNFFSDILKKHASTKNKNDMGKPSTFPE